MTSNAVIILHAYTNPLCQMRGLTELFEISLLHQCTCV